MPITVVTEPGAPNANSYITTEYMDAFAATHPFATAWTSIADGERKKMLVIEATRRIDGRAYLGLRTYSTQALMFPRLSLWDPDRGVVLDPYAIPADVQLATAKLVLQLAPQTTDTTQPNKLAQFKSIGLPGGVKLELRDGFKALDQWPPDVEGLLVKFMAFDDGPVYLERGG